MNGGEQKMSALGETNDVEGRLGPRRRSRLTPGKPAGILTGSACHPRPSVASRPVDRCFVVTPSDQPVTRLLAAFAARAQYADLPAAAVVDTRRAVLDWLGSVMAGASEPPARMTQRVVSGLGRSDEASVFGAGRATDVGR